MNDSSKFQRVFQSLEEPGKRGSLGIGAEHIESGIKLGFNETHKFFMCSTFKIPLAIYLLYKVQKKEISLNQLYNVTEYDLRAGINSTLNQLNYNVSQSISIYNILKFMLQESCNTSSDILLRLIGGPNVVTDYLAQCEISNLRIDRYILEILAASDGIKDIPKGHRCTLEQYKELELSVSQEELDKSKDDFKKDIRDTTAPLAMNQLLVNLSKNNLINKEYTDLLLTIMRGCKTGQHRLRGLLPKDTPFAHKTGTFSGFMCDVGIITLPFNLGNISIACYIKESEKSQEDNELILAEVGRLIYDYFLFSISN